MSAAPYQHDLAVQKSKAQPTLQDKCSCKLLGVGQPFEQVVPSLSNADRSNSVLTIQKLRSSIAEVVSPEASCHPKGTIDHKIDRINQPQIEKGEAQASPFSLYWPAPTHLHCARLVIVPEADCC
jgi:hypothetical protein